MPRESHEDLPSNHTCEKCGEHEASGWWIGDGGTLAVTRYRMQAAWCECCMLEVQVEHARKLAATLAELEGKLASVSCKKAKGVSDE